MGGAAFSAEPVVFLIGAGASKDSGVPLALEFSDAVREHLTSLPHNDAQPLIEALERVLATLPDGKKDLESLYQAIDDTLDGYFSDARVLPPFPGIVPDRALERLHYEIKKCIQQRCFISDATRVAHLQGLLPFISRRCPLCIASLNYDNAVELWARGSGLSLHDPMVDVARAAQQPDILLLKLHGSLTWYVDRSGKLARFEPFSLGSVRKIKALRTATLETPLIYPSRRKLPIQAPFLGNAVRFQQALDSSRHLVAVGCRFVDEHVRTWVIDAMRTNPRLDFTVLSPDADKVIGTFLMGALTSPLVDRCYATEGDGKFKNTLNAGLVKALEHRVPARLVLASEDKLRGVIRLRIDRMPVLPESIAAPVALPVAGPVHGLTASPDGRGLFLAAGGDRRNIEFHDLMTGETSTLLKKAGEVRGLAVAPNGNGLYFVDNALFRFTAFPTSGLGRVRYLDFASNRTRNVTRPQLQSLRRTLRLAQREGWKASLRPALTNVLSWPTEIVADSAGNGLFVTEARALSRVALESGSVHAVASPPLCFNLHALAQIDPDRLVAVEQGVGQAHGWGRVLELTRSGEAWNFDVRVSGFSRLFGAAYYPRRHLVLLAQNLTWPFGRLLAFHYPSFLLAGALAGLDFPERIATHPSWDFVIISSRSGLARLDESALPPSLI